jgi:hypothetical protein
MRNLTITTPTSPSYQIARFHVSLSILYFLIYIYICPEPVNRLRLRVPGYKLPGTKPVSRFFGYPELIDARLRFPGRL